MTVRGLLVHYGTIASGNQVMRDGDAVGRGAEDIDLPRIAPNGTAGAARAVVAAYPPPAPPAPAENEENSQDSSVTS